MFKSILPLLLALLSLPALADAGFTKDADAFFQRYVTAGTVDYAALKSSNAIDPLIATIAATDPATLKGDERKAYLINAYNLLVINQALKNYPLKSVLDVPGFFDNNKVTVGGWDLTLNQLEKDVLLKNHPDARLHFVLVCGALGCPPITDFAYDAAKLEAQLESQTRSALNDGKFIRVDGDQVGLSKIFEWYQSDFGGSRKKALEFINGYRNNALPAEPKVSYYEYDWKLNAAGPGRTSVTTPAPSRSTAGPASTVNTGNNAFRYVVSSTINKGTAEVKIFNNLYRQTAQNETSTFFTSQTNALYGVTDRFNAGVEARFRRASYTGGESDASRTGLTSFGPFIRVAPFGKLPNFSVQSTFRFALGEDLTGAETGQRFLDWEGNSWFTQVFNDFPIGDNFSVFGEVDFLLEDIGAQEDGRLNRFSTPVTGILSYFPTPKTTVYGLASYSPFWQTDFDYFYQFGGGLKYQITPKLELEMLVTAFDNEFLNSVAGTAATYNFGIRFNL